MGKFYQTEDSKALAASAEGLAAKLEIIGLNLIEMKKFKQRSQKQLNNLEAVVPTFVKQDLYRQEYADVEQRTRDFIHRQLNSLQESVTKNRSSILDNIKLFEEQINQCRKDTLWKVQDIEQLLNNRISKQ